MSDDRAKAENGEARVDPALKKEKAGSPSSSTPQPVNPAGGQRRENESPANRDEDGRRKRAEEGL